MHVVRLCPYHYRYVWIVMPTVHGHACRDPSAIYIPMTEELQKSEALRLREKEERLDAEKQRLEADGVPSTDLK